MFSTALATLKKQLYNKHFHQNKPTHHIYISNFFVFQFLCAIEDQLKDNSTGRVITGTVCQQI